MALQEPAIRRDDPDDDRSVRWMRADGVELLGEATGTGLTKPVYLVRRADGQVAQLSRLLYLVLESSSEPSEPAAIARRVSEACGQELDAEGASTLAERLSPIGFLTRDDAPPPPKLATATPLLALTVKGTLIPKRAVHFLADIFRPLFATPIVIAAVMALAALDTYLFLRADAFSALQAVLVTPAMLLSLYALLLAGTIFHEIGHAAACRYGGADPGVIGVGLYLVFPAFYTNVTDSYRLGRAGRIRTDLGGLYFHLIWVLTAGVGFLTTGSPLLVMLIIATQIQMMQQLPPFVRLDGYFVLADLAGVPDLFARVKPVIASLIPGRPADPRVSELKPYSRWIVTAWVLVVIPFLTIVMAWLVLTLPIIIEQTVGAATLYLTTLLNFVQNGQLVEALLSALGLFLLVLPVVGLCAILAQLVTRLVRWASARFTAERGHRAGLGRHTRRNPRHRQVPTGHA
ncbi:hypothetical protein SCMU_11670 [Sinomonas cyclohexanicum]|uniref:Peptide zinc metalloprotease protein n=1 Tax=Sinomonas cyclohexanicum TaxID=322009 RepID=A0ABN6FG46_SINCY|nr:hypothetical protein [Corynebacterium cyclohexanicum]BCT75325.1 hypothetical protein SCMU_11670 [Corynebacterium cyclohexanicum]